MPVESKVVFLKELEQNLADKITSADLLKVLPSVADVLQNYSMNSITTIGSCENDDMFEAYITAMEVRGLSPVTIERYRYVVKKLMDDLRIPTRNVTVHHIRAYLSKQKNKGLADTSLNSLRHVFSAYFGWLWREGLIDHNPLGNLGSIKCQVVEKGVLTEPDIEKLKNGCSYTRHTIRNKAIIEFLKSTACRVGEVHRLNIADIDFEHLRCTVLGKGNKERVVYMSNVAAMYLKNYLDKRTDDNPALFVGERHERLGTRGIQSMLRKLGRIMCIEKVHPHKFRRTELTELARREMPIEQIRVLAGHEKIDTTLKYVKLDKSQIESNYRKFA